MPSVDNISKNGKKTKVRDVTHPEYTRCRLDWLKWRTVYEGGERFIDEYLQRYSSREDLKDFNLRRKVSYNPAFAAAAVDEVKNSIYQRTTDITRAGGPASYQEACDGDLRGVDLLGKSMNSFIGIDVLPELLVMRKVGIYVDMPPLDGVETVADLRARRARPYVYIFPAEDIRSWALDAEYNPNEFSRLLLRETNWKLDSEYGLPSDEEETFRLLSLEEVELNDGNYGRRVHVQRFDKDDNPLSTKIRLEIDRIPFICLEITESLLNNAANYQIALLNLASADLGYCLSANFPFYTEQFDPRVESNYTKTDDDFPDFEGNGVFHAHPRENVHEIRVGPSVGRRYPKDVNAPAFIHPSPEPMKASMEKQQQLRDDIRLLVGLSLSNIQPKMASAESKAVDVEGLEAGLSYIGLVLQHAERKIAQYWAMYEGNKTPAEVKYPERWSLQSSADKREEVKHLLVCLEVTGSVTLRKTICKKLIDLIAGSFVNDEQLTKMYSEIDKASMILPTFDSVIAAITAGFASLEDAAKNYGFDPEIVTRASAEHEARLERIAKAQTPQGDLGARGVRDLGQDPNAAKNERAAANDNTKKAIPQDQSRGEGK